MINFISLPIFFSFFYCILGVLAISLRAFSIPSILSVLFSICVRFYPYCPHFSAALKLLLLVSFSASVSHSICLFFYLSYPLLYASYSVYLLHCFLLIYFSLESDSLHAPFTLILIYISLALNLLTSAFLFLFLFLSSLQPLLLFT